MALLGRVSPVVWSRASPGARLLCFWSRTGAVTWKGARRGSDGGGRRAERALYGALGALGLALLLLALTATASAQAWSPGGRLFVGALAFLARALSVLAFLVSGWGLLAVRWRSVPLMLVNVLALAVALSVGLCR